jgi:hypothetical protein
MLALADSALGVYRNNQVAGCKIWLASKLSQLPAACFFAHFRAHPSYPLWSQKRPAPG